MVYGLALATKLSEQTAKRKEEEKMSHKMSRDRIEFRAGIYQNTYHYSGNHAHPSDTHRHTREALVRTMGMTAHEADEAVRSNRVIRCRPSQFGRFIVVRCNLGIKCNGVKCLEPKQISPEPPVTEPIDVSTNPAAHDRKSS